MYMYSSFCVVHRCSPTCIVFMFFRCVHSRLSDFDLIYFAPFCACSSLSLLYLVGVVHDATLWEFLSTYSLSMLLRFLMYHDWSKLSFLYWDKYFLLTTCIYINTVTYMYLKTASTCESEHLSRSSVLKLIATSDMLFTGKNFI